MYIDHLSILLRIAAALMCGALLGAEREYRGREAGLKSHAGLAVGCCLAIIVSAFGFSDAVTQGLITLDPSRIAAGVEGGIGFACAAVIWRSRSKVIGLTTAINIWATANIAHGLWLWYVFCCRFDYWCHVVHPCRIGRRGTLVFPAPQRLHSDDNSSARQD